MTFYKLNGFITKKWKDCYLLRFYSKPLAEKILLLNHGVHLTNYLDGFKLEPNGCIHVTLIRRSSGRLKGIQIAVTKLIKKKSLEIERKTKEIPIYLDPQTWKISKLVEKARNGTASKYSISNGRMVEIPASMSVSKNKYYLHFTLKCLAEIVKGKYHRCIIAKKDGRFVLLGSNFDPTARKITAYGKGRIQISVPRSLLDSNEIKKLNKDGHYSTKLKFYLDDFNLNFNDFYHIKEEKELAAALEQEGFHLKPRLNRIYDISFDDISIEVHNSKPTGFSNSQRHGIKAGQVRLRILEGSYYIKKLKLKSVFIIINDGWKKNNYITALAQEMKDNRVYIIYSDFKNTWAERVVSIIKHTLLTN